MIDTSANPYQNLFISVITSLHEYNVPYVLVGGAVMPYYGNIRSTQDIDIMLKLDEIPETIITQWLEDLDTEQFSFSKSEIIYAMNEGVHANIFETNTYTFRIDLKKISGKLDRLTFTTRKMVNIFGLEVWVCSPESLIGIKSSPGFRAEHDINDIYAIVETINLDTELLSKFLDITGSMLYFCKLMDNSDSVRASNLHMELDC